MCVFVCAGTPKHLDYEEVKNDLNAVEGVKHHPQQDSSGSTPGSGSVSCMCVYVKSERVVCAPQRWPLWRGFTVLQTF